MGKVLDMTLVDGLTIFALIAGPVTAVLITRYWDAKREANRRKWEIFRTLMRNRRERLNPEFVGALNLLKVEFHREHEVISAWKDLFNHLCQSTTGIKEQEERRLEDTERLTATLLEKIAKSLGVEKDSLEIFKSGYSPQGWGDLETEQSLIRRLLFEVLANQSPLPVHISNFQNNQEDATSENPNHHPM